MSLDNLKVRHMKMLLALSEHGKLGMVAELFGVSQPAFSRTLSDLENMVGQKLFERHRRGMVITPQGEIVIRHAKIVLADTRRAEFEMRSVAAGHGGVVTFGSIMTAAAEIVAPTLRRVFATHPRLDIKADVASSAELLESVLSRRLDFAICRITDDFNPGMFDYHYLGHDPLKLVVGRGHPLAERTYVPIEDLAGYDWVLEPEGSYLRRAIDEFATLHNIPRGNIISTPSLLLMIALVMGSGMIGIFARPVADLLDRHGMLRAVPTGPDITLPEFGIVKLKDRALSPSAAIVFYHFTNQATQAD
ncbi:transcriptional regulator [Rhizobium sp. Root1203]|uniref:LysR family transcriptional regulator n=1 Tax=Rhizobium sp. Root1203 TaxID=1736427 RepID=UPI00070B9FE6|nr:LysR family transcriptional regulator [Rhizobium sp. Root1203]KQV17314.1 transcriptional regulator [Rhizobium sp. Root1203]